MVNTHLSPNGAKAWRVNCGSFVANGHHGTVNDYMFQMFITCVDPPRQPTRIAMGDKVYAYMADARECQFGEVARAVVEKLQTREEREDYLSELQQLRDLLTRPMWYHGAEIVQDRELSEDVMLFYDGDELVGECGGWTA